MEERARMGERVLRRSRERKEPGTKTTAKVRATDSPWFNGVGENLVVWKVSISLGYALRTTDRLTPPIRASKTEAPLKLWCIPI